MTSWIANLRYFRGHLMSLSYLGLQVCNGLANWCYLVKIKSAYLGLVPSTYASGGKVFHGRITKTGSKWLRWAAIEAAQTAVRSNSEFHAYYQRIKIRKGTNAAKVATARRLLTIVYRLLRQKRLYERRITTPGKLTTPAALVRH